MHLVESNGASIPAIGLGTWQLSGDECADIVAEGLRRGYRHVDTAQAYGNEREVGEGIRASGLPRDDVFLTTKIWYDCLEPAVLRPTAEERLAVLGVEVVDLLLVHWPNPDVPLADTMAALAAAKHDGLARHIGVSNFTTALVDQAVAACPEPLVTNQVEYHPLIDQSRVLDACRRSGLSMTAYCPVARGRILEHDDVRRIAETHGRTPAQIALRWLVQQDRVIAIPKTANKERLSENLAIFDFSLSETEMATLSTLASPEGRVVNPAWSPDWD